MPFKFNPITGSLDLVRDEAPPVQYATEEEAGVTRFASQQEVDDGVVNDEAVTPATLKNNLSSIGYTRQFSGIFSLVASVPRLIPHSLGLIDKDAFTISVMLNGSQVGVDVDSVDEDNLTITSLVSVASVRVTVVGASAAQS